MGHKGIEMLNRHYGGWLEEAADNYIPSDLFTANRNDTALSEQGA